MEDQFEAPTDDPVRRSPSERPMADKRRSDRRDIPEDPEARATRLAELVAGLTGTPPGSALHAVRTEPPDQDALEVVANAMVNVDRPPPEACRLAGFLRDATPAGPTRPDADTDEDAPPDGA